MLPRVIQLIQLGGALLHIRLFLKRRGDANKQDPLHFACFLEYLDKVLGELAELGLLGVVEEISERLAMSGTLLVRAIASTDRVE